MGDFLYASIVLDEAAAARYNPTGFKGIGKLNGAKANNTDRDFNFVDGEPVFIGGGDIDVSANFPNGVTPVCVNQRKQAWKTKRSPAAEKRSFQSPISPGSTALGNRIL